MIFTSFEIEHSKKIAIFHLINSTGSYTQPILKSGYDLRNKYERKALAKIAVDKLNEKHNTTEFSEVF